MGLVHVRRPLEDVLREPRKHRNELSLFPNLHFGVLAAPHDVQLECFVIELDLFHLLARKRRFDGAVRGKLTIPLGVFGVAGVQYLTLPLPIAVPEDEEVDFFGNDKRQAPLAKVFTPRRANTELQFALAVKVVPHLVVRKGEVSPRPAAEAHVFFRVV